MQLKNNTRVQFLFLFYGICQPVFGDTAIKMPVKIVRFAYTGEHFMFDTAKTEKIFSELFLDGKLTFKSFHANSKIAPSTYDWSAKTEIGSETYELQFENLTALRTFIENKLPAVPNYEFFGGLEHGIFVGIRDYIVKHKETSLAKLMLAKMKSKDFANSANEGKSTLYKPLKALQK
jgi:hypothetical protein